MNPNNLEARVEWVWRETVRIHRNFPETRLASSLSPIEALVSLFYGGILKFFPNDPLHSERDRLIISKGHGSICMYPILADLGFFSREELDRVCQEDGILGGIPDPIIPGYETVNGSLGHGLGVASGIAIAQKSLNLDRNVFVLCGDGEMHEGACWEAIMFASHHSLDNLTLIVDDNSIAMLGFTADIVSHGDLGKRLASFGWETTAINGHDVELVCRTLGAMKTARPGKPKALILKTLKGRGVPNLENEPMSHVLNPKPETLDQILEFGDD
ncbi:MAG: transketolase [Pseudomonadota bacterium]|nr:transketolase [Pseudomonadota bacterium]